jgi:hypothetical protein
VLDGPAIPDNVSELAMMAGPFTCRVVPNAAVPTNVKTLNPIKQMYRGSFPKVLFVVIVSVSVQAPSGLEYNGVGLVGNVVFDA